MVFLWGPVSILRGMILSRMDVAWRDVWELCFGVRRWQFTYLSIVGFVLAFRALLCGTCGMRGGLGW